MPRRPRNARPDLNGVLVIDKPVGPTSMDVCRAVRRVSGGAKVGHAGTLDPLASGVLVVCLGRATRAVDRLMTGEKQYDARIDLSCFSTTDDLEGDAVPVHVESPPTREHVERALAHFVGEIDQRPPAHSAVHIGGKRAYQLARRGDLDEHDIPTKRVVIHAIDLVEYDWPRLRIDVRCGKGTYIRSLARDVGRALGTGGRLEALRRTKVGEFTIDQATPLDAIPNPLTPEHLRNVE